MKKGLIIMLLPLAALLQNCNNYDSDILVQQWRNDSLGCRDLRTEAAARTLYKRYNLKQKTPAQIIDVLGKPNKMLDDGAQVFIAYYFGTVCSEGKLVDSIDHCWASFTYIDKANKECHLSITCH